MYDIAVIQIGLDNDLIVVSEDVSSISVCVELIEGNACYRPVNARLLTRDGSAKGIGCINGHVRYNPFLILAFVGGEDYDCTISVISFPVGSRPGAKFCASINIADDLVEESTEEFTVHLEVVDLNIVIPPAATSYVTVRILDDDGKTIMLMFFVYSVDHYLIPFQNLTFSSMQIHLW